MECHAHPSHVAPRNIVQREVNGKIEYRFVDFHDVDYHECHFDGQWDGEDGRMPKGGIGCALLTSAAQDAFFWVNFREFLMRSARTGSHIFIHSPNSIYVYWSPSL